MRSFSVFAFAWLVLSLVFCQAGLAQDPPFLTIEDEAGGRFPPTPVDDNSTVFTIIPGAACVFEVEGDPGANYYVLVSDTNTGNFGVGQFVTPPFFHLRPGPATYFLNAQGIARITAVVPRNFGLDHTFYIQGVLTGPPVQLTNGITFEITAPSAHAGFSLRSLKEILFDLEFSQEALDEEKQVILEELSQLQDDPFRLAFSMVYQNLFPGHPYQRPIYGTPENIRNATAEDLGRFYRSFLAPSNSSLAVVGDFSIPDMEAMVKEIFGPLGNEGFKPAEFAKTLPLSKTAEIEHEMDVQMAYLAIGLNAPDFNSEDQYAMDVLTEIFGRGIYPMIYQPLMQKRIPVSSLRMGYSAHRYGGALTMAMALEPKYLNRAKREITQYLKRSRRLNYSSDDVFGDAELYAMDYMESAKNRLRFLGEQAMERGLAIATSLARFMLLTETRDRGDYLEHIEAIKTTDLRSAAGKYLAQKGLVVVTIRPQKDN